MPICVAIEAVQNVEKKSLREDPERQSRSGDEAICNPKRKKK